MRSHASVWLNAVQALRLRSSETCERPFAPFAPFARVGWNESADDFRGAIMSATHQKVHDGASEHSNPVNDDFPKVDQGPQCASFILEVRNRVQVTHELIERINTIMTESGFDVTLTPTQVVAGSVPLPEKVISTATIRANVRGEARLVNWTQDGTLVWGVTVETAWGVKRQSVDAARERGEIFSVWVKGKHWYPSEALKVERSALAAINRALGNADPSSKLLFLLRKHGALGGQTPADAVIAGKRDDVLRLAADWART